MGKEYDLTKFLKAQELSYSWALREMQRGKKQTHWMWFIFPQLKALGKSSTALYYGLENIDEAKAYLDHSILGERLREISSVLTELDIGDPYVIFGYPDNLKLCSCMTLFAEIEGYDSVFGRVLKKFYGGAADQNTIRILKEGK